MPVSGWQEAALPAWGAAVVISLQHSSDVEGSSASNSSDDGVLLLCTGWPTGDPADDDDDDCDDQSDDGEPSGGATTSTAVLAACTADPWVVYLPSRLRDLQTAARTDFFVRAAEKEVSAAMVAANETMQPVRVWAVGGSNAPQGEGRPLQCQFEEQQQQQQHALVADKVVVRVLQHAPSAARTTEGGGGGEDGGDHTTSTQRCRAQALLRSARRALLGRAVATGCIAGIQIKRVGAGAGAGASGARSSGGSGNGIGSGRVFEVVSTVPYSTPTHPLVVNESTTVQVEPSSLRDDKDGIGSETTRATQAASNCGSNSSSLPPKQPRSSLHQCLPGLETAHRSLVGLVAAALQHEKLFAKIGLDCPKGVLLCGPPGTGKTLLAQTAAADCGADLIVINGPELIGEFLGDSEANLRRVFADAVRKAQSSATVLFIDELDALCPRRQRGQSHENRVVAQLLTLMDGLESRGRLVILAATNRPNALDPAVRRPGRFDREVVVGVPSAEDRKAILELHTAQFPLAADVDLGLVAAEAVGYVGADLAALAREAALAALERAGANTGGNLDLLDLGVDGKRRSAPSIDDGPRLGCSAGGGDGDDDDGNLKIVITAASDRAAAGAGDSEGAAAAVAAQLPHVLPNLIAQVTRADFSAALAASIPSTQRGGEVHTGTTTWDSIGGLEDVKQSLRQVAEWPLLYAATYTRLGIEAPRGVLLYGPPGCAKTTMVRALANSCQATFHSLNGAQIFSPYLGDAEETVRETFKRARLGAPAILFMDEVDAIVGNRAAGGSDSSGVQERVLSTLLNEMDGVESAGGVLVVGATNRPDMLDSAFLRAGRIDRMVYVPPPDLAGRLAILKVHTAKIPLATDVNLSVYAKCTEGFSGADLENMCREAALEALRKSIAATTVNDAHFETALLSSRPSLTPEVLAKYTEQQRE